MRPIFGYSFDPLTPCFSSFAPVMYMFPATVPASHWHVVGVPPSRTAFFAPI
jgi:hypothetical protein